MRSWRRRPRLALASQGFESELRAARTAAYTTRPISAIHNSIIELIQNQSEPSIQCTASPFVRLSFASRRVRGIGGGPERCSVRSTDSPAWANRPLQPRAWPRRIAAISSEGIRARSDRSATTVTCSETIGAMATMHETDRLRALVETGIAINSELSLDGVLERIAEAAARVTEARYAALGVIDPSGTALERFVAYGNLYLTEKEGGGEFTEEDEELVTLLAGQAAVAVENARLCESATSWSQQLESLNEVGAALVGELELEPLLDLVAGRLRELIGARLVAIALPAGDALRIAAMNGEGVDDLAAITSLERDSKTGRVLERGRSERVDSLLEDPEVNQDVARRLGATTGLYVPLLVRDRPIGVLVAHDKVGRDQRFGSGDLRLAEQFALRASIAVDLSQRVARDALRRVVEGQEVERRRLARELHDETGQALTSILLGLRAAEDAAGPDEARKAVSDLRELVVGTLQDVRRLAVQLRPKALDDFGLAAALERLAQTFAETSGGRVDLEARLGDERLPAEVETTL